MALFAAILLTAAGCSGSSNAGGRTSDPAGEIVDRLLVDDDDGVYVVSEGGEWRRVLDHPVSRVVDDGEGGLIYQLVRSSDPDVRWSQRRVPPANEDEEVIWHLAAGATEPVVFARPDGERAWLALDDAGRDDDGRRVVVYAEVDGRQNCVALDEMNRCAPYTDIIGWAETPERGRRRIFEGEPMSRPMVAADGVVYLPIVELLDERLAVTFLGPDGPDGDAGHTVACHLDPGAFDKCGAVFLGPLDRDSWVSIGNTVKPEFERCSASETDTDCEALAWDLPEDLHYLTLDVVGPVAIVTATESFREPVLHTFLLELDEGAASVRELDLDARATLLSAPLALDPA